MAIGTAQNVQDPFFLAGYFETLQQETDIFNAASAGALRLETSGEVGNFTKTTFAKAVSGLISRRDPTSTTALTSKSLDFGLNATVKRHMTIGPVENTLDSLRKQGISEEEFALILGQQAGKEQAAYAVNDLATALGAALNGTAALKNDITAATLKTLSHGALIDTLAKMGDAANRVAIWVMHSKAYFDLMKQSVADNVVGVAGVTIQSGTVASINRPVIVTDSPSLVVAGSPNTYRTLGLVAGAGLARVTELPIFESQRKLGAANITRIWQGELAHNIGIKGYTWDTANGGAAPTDAALGTATNWDATASSDKDKAGVILVSQ